MQVAPSHVDNHRINRRGWSSGLTLVEMLTVTLIASLLCAMAVPSFQDWIHKQRLDGHTQELMQDLYWLRSQAVGTQNNMLLSLGTTSNGSCYVLHDGKPGACTCNAEGQSTCSAGSKAYKTVHLDNSEAIRVSGNVRSLLWDSRQGTVTPAATLKLESTTGKTLQVVINMMGRVRTCVESGALAAYTPC